MKKTLLFVLGVILMGTLKVNAQVTDYITGLEYTAYGLAIKDGKMYVAQRDPATLFFYINTFDMNNLSQASQQQYVPEAITSLNIHEDYLYITDFYGFVKRQSISNPSSGFQTVIYVNNGTSHGITDLAFKDNFIYLTAGTSNSIIKADLSAANPQSTISTVLSGLNFPSSLNIKGNDLYFANDGKLSKIDLTSANPTKIDIVSGISSPQKIHRQGEYIYIPEFYSPGRITKVDLRTGTPVVTEIITGLTNPTDITTDGVHMYITEGGAKKVVKFETPDMGEYTYVPDDQFEKALIDLSYDTGVLDDFVPTANINTVNSLFVNNKGIKDLRGIENFTALQSLHCINNQLKKINLKNNTNLITLVCATNQISDLSTFNPSLQVLNINENGLSTIDVSSYTNLKTLYVAGNTITNIDLSANTALEDFRCFSNNNLTSLDLSGNTALTQLNCQFNPALTSLNLKNGNNTNITSFVSASTPLLTCIQVDDATYSTTHWTNRDNANNFSEDCAAYLSTADIAKNKIKIYPNPALNYLNIQLKDSQFKKAEVYNLKGQLLITSSTSNLEISTLSSGVYIVKITDKNNRTGAKRIIKM